MKRVLEGPHYTTREAVAKPIVLFTDELYRVSRSALFVPLLFDGPSRGVIGHNVILRWKRSQRIASPFYSSKNRYSFEVFEVVGLDPSFEPPRAPWPRRWCPIGNEHLHLLEMIRT